MIKKPIQLCDPLPIQKKSQAVEIPKHFPLIVRDVAESLAIRDPESARRYLEAHLEQKSRMRKDGSTFDSIGDN